MHRKITILMTLLTLLAVSPIAHAQNATKLGVVDFQRALNEVSEGKKAKANLENRMETVKAEVEKRRKEIEELQEGLKAQEMMLSDEARAEKERDYQTKAYEFQQLVVTSQQEMALLQEELTSGILEKLYKVAQGVGAEDGYNMIVEATAVVYINGVIDITDQVIARYNKKK